ncbi:MAG: hypothetical protein ABSC16_02595 [Candidatus Dormibacteria bacterium]
MAAPAARERERRRRAAFGGCGSAVPIPDGSTGGRVRSGAGIVGSCGETATGDRAVIATDGGGEIAGDDGGEIAAGAPAVKAAELEVEVASGVATGAGAWVAAPAGFRERDRRRRVGAASPLAAGGAPPGSAAALNARPSSTGAPGEPESGARSEGPPGDAALAIPSAGTGRAVATVPGEGAGPGAASSPPRSSP